MLVMPVAVMSQPDMPSQESSLVSREVPCSVKVVPAENERGLDTAKSRRLSMFGI